MFSTRLPADLSESPIARAARELRANDAAICDLTISNPTRAGFSYPEEEIREAYSRASTVAYEPHPRGLARAREAIAEYYAGEAERREGGEAAWRAGGERSDARAGGVSVDPRHIHCTASSSEAYGMLFKLLCEPGDDVCIPHPAYPLFAWLAGLDAVRVRPYDLRLAPDGRWRVDMHSLDQAVTDRTRAVIVVNPSNPAGNYLRPDDFVLLDAFCARRGIALIVDEVFWDFPLDERIDADRLRQRSAGAGGEALRFTINGFSKLLGLPQSKLGWMITEGPAPLRDEALERLDVIADAYLSVSTAVMAAAPALLALRGDMQAQILSRCTRNLAFAAVRLGGTADDSASGGGALLLPEGGWSILLRLGGEEDEEHAALRLLEEQRVLVHPGTLFDIPRGRHFVLSLLAGEDAFRAGTEKLLAFLKNPA